MIWITCTAMVCVTALIIAAMHSDDKAKERNYFREFTAPLSEED